MTRRLIGSLAAIAVLAAAATAVAGASPVNDNFVAAAALNFGGQNTGTTLNATEEAGEPHHGPGSSGATNSVWYRFTAPLNGIVEIEGCDADVKFYIEAYTGAAVNVLALVPRQYNQVCPPQRRGGAADGDQLAFRALAGVTYSISVASKPVGDEFTLKPAFTPTGDDSSVPDTAIIKGPKKKKRKKTTTFEFASNEGGAIFQCSLNGSVLVPCVSPVEVRGKRGWNTFLVLAIDPSGNPDPTPATYYWRVKKKKRK